MERHAHYALVGMISTLLLLAGFVFVIWLGQYQFDHQYDLYRIVFQGPVRGLSNGGEVQFNGIKIGEIQHISLDAADPNKVIMNIRADGGTPVRVDSVFPASTSSRSALARPASRCCVMWTIANAPPSAPSPMRCRRCCWGEVRCYSRPPRLWGG